MEILWYHFTRGMCGWIIFDPRGNKVLTYALGLGQKTNNEAEWIALLFEMEQIKHNKITNGTVVGDCSQVIHKMIYGYIKWVVEIQSIYDQIRKTSINIHTSFFHILRSKYSKANIFEN